ncbi:MAG: class I SAM-dependent methyltransferase [Cyanobacteria bacterium SID2]|nr:class I SAM-dependent methyltransferase [Cyanobacteria bacterium SID2]MBP0004075.1 class I SAM-dependent methyltransferase [Cyanobacteria bacterium SBC]
MKMVQEPKDTFRSFSQIEKHYRIEKELAQRLKNSTLVERKYLYTQLYDELYQKVTDHSQITRASSPEIRQWIVNQRMSLLKRFLNPKTTYLELGPGDCNLACEVAKTVSKVYAVDVSSEIVKHLQFPKNLEFILSDGCSVPVPENSVDVAYSHQLMEHLHPEDAIAQLENIYKALAPNGIYICITPNRLSGPHDISKHFDKIATGFHLKEYILSELRDIFVESGFRKVFWIKNKNNVYLKIPLNPLNLSLLKTVETLLKYSPYPIRKSVANTPFLFRGMTVIGVK